MFGKEIAVNETGIKKSDQLMHSSAIPQKGRRIPYLFVKRLLDLFFAIVGLFLLLPMTICVVIANRLAHDSGPIFYCQERVGKDGKLFKLYKYRTMNVEAENQIKEILKDRASFEEWASHQKLSNDPRITAVGKKLRAWSIDEFPQFINVLKGDMSCIGPRPLVPGELESHGGKPCYWDMKPGITSWWGCNGRSDVSYDERLELEYYYIDNCSLILDLKCVVKTIRIVLKQEGAR